MSLDAERWQRLSPLLDEALELPADARETWLAALREREPDLVDELRTLLAGKAAADRARFVTGQAAPAQVAQQAGRRIGAYTLLEPLGEGGMGAVWLAERNDGRYEGRAAVKLLHAGLLQRALAERFRREGAILAKLSHPHIARLLDAGLTDDGQPYLVLEHVAGQRIDAACDARQLGVRERIVLFAQVLEAVQHAHNRLVVHRDLKPGNVMVDATGAVKLLDFGIAKLLDAEDAAGEATALTQEAGRLLTPQYAAPEQRAGEAVTTATDVYALGLLLYELLTGQHPRVDAQGRHEPASATAPPLASRVVTDPQRRDAAELERNARARGTTPAQLAAALAGDIDNILLKALRHDAAERYATVDAFADDLRRHLAGETVSARPDSLGYRMSRFIGRHRIAVAATAGSALAIVVLTALAMWQASEAQAQREVALRSRDQALKDQLVAESTSAFLSEMVGVSKSGGQPMNAAEQVDHAEAMAQRLHFDQPDVLGHIQAALVGRNVMLNRFDRVASGLQVMQEAARASGDALAKVRVQCWQHLAIDSGQKQQLLEGVQAALASLADEPRSAAVRVQCLSASAELKSDIGRHEDAIGDLTAALQVARTYPAGLRGSEPVYESKVGQLLMQAGRLMDADLHFARAGEQLVRLGKEKSVDRALTLNLRGSIRATLGQPLGQHDFVSQAIDVVREMSTAGEPPVYMVANLAGALVRLRRMDEAATWLAKAIPRVRSEGFPAEHAMRFEASLLWAQGKPALAIALLEPSLTHANPKDSRSPTFANRLLLAEILLDERDIERAARAIDGMQAAAEVGDRNHRKAHVLGKRARWHNLAGRPAEAQAAAEELLKHLPSFVPDKQRSNHRGHALLELAIALAAQGQREEARNAARRAVVEFSESCGPSHPDTQRAVAVAS